MAVACAVEALQEEDAAEEVPFGGDFPSCRSTPEDGLDERGLLGSLLSGLAHPPEVRSRVMLDELHLAQLHLVVGVAQQPEVALLGEVAAQILLHYHGVLRLEKAALLLLREEHSNVALDVDHDQLQFHMHDFFASAVPSVSPLDHASGQHLHVERLNAPLSPELQLRALELEVAHEGVLHDRLSLHWLALRHRDLPVLWTHGLRWKRSGKPQSATSRPQERRVRWSRCSLRLLQRLLVAPVVAGLRRLVVDEDPVLVRVQTQLLLVLLPALEQICSQLPFEVVRYPRHLLLEVVEESIRHPVQHVHQPLRPLRASWTQVDLQQPRIELLIQHEVEAIYLKAIALLLHTRLLR